MTIDINKLENLLEESNYDGARTLIAEFIKAPLTEEERGEALVNFASVYLNVSNNINEEYKAVLTDAIASIKLINKAESKMKDETRLTELHQELGV